LGGHSIEQRVANADDVWMGDERASDGIADAFAGRQRPLFAAWSMGEMQCRAAAHSRGRAVDPTEPPIKAAILVA
jgi:hypothetical protein